MRISALVAAASLPLLSQVPDAAFFTGDPKVLMVACADKARSLKPRNSRLLAEVGRAYLASGDRAKAEETFKAAVAADPADGHTYRIIGESWLKFGFRKEGLEAIEQIRIKDPRAKNPMAQAAAALVEAGLVKEAEDLMEVAYNLGRSDWQNLTQYGRACIRGGKPELAARWFSLAVKSAPKDESIWNDIALSLADQGREN